MKLLLNNLLLVLKRFKTSSILNILGLTTAFASFLIILMQVNYEYSFDKYHPKNERIYRVDLQGTDNESGKTNYQPTLPRPFVHDVMQSSPHIVAGTIINPWVTDFYVTVEKDGKQNGFKESFVTCDAEITQLFHFKMVEGESDCLHKPEMALIPQSMALRMFENESAIGKQITLSGYLWAKQDKGFLVVGGVYEDFPSNTQLNNCIYTAMETGYDANNWANYNYMCYILLDENTTPETVAGNFNQQYDFHELSFTQGTISVRLTPLTDIYHSTGYSPLPSVKTGNPQMPVILLTIGFLIILIAVINYTNFAMALAPRRMKAINIHKILGSTNFSLRINIVVESLVLSLLSFIIAVFSVHSLYTSHPVFITIDLNPAHNLSAFFITGLVAIATGIIAGVRPAFYMTSFQPVLAINGSFGLSASGKRLRMTLVGFQFFISIVLVTSAFYVYKQNKFMQKYNLGYDTEQVLLAELPQSIFAENRNVFVANLKNNPAILDIAFSAQKFGASDQYRVWGGKYNETGVGFYALDVSWNFPAVMGIKAIDGRLPEESDDKGILFVVNKTFQNESDMKPGERLDVPWLGVNENPNNFKILGVVDDVMFTSLRLQVENMAFVFNDHSNGQPWSYIRIRAGADLRQVVKYIEETISDLDSAYPVKVEFYDDVFNNLYNKEITFEFIINLFSLIAIIIALVGVFGLVMFECEFKRKEIGIRKIMGSTEWQILKMVNKIYLQIFGICFVIAVPVSYYIISSWLDNFAYKTAMRWWEFGIVGLSVLTVIVSTVTWQSWKAAMENPVEAIKAG
jgi:putative ABC transport system permease protein